MNTEIAPIPDPRDPNAPPPASAPVPPDKASGGRPASGASPGHVLDAALEDLRERGEAVTPTLDHILHQVVPPPIP